MRILAIIYIIYSSALYMYLYIRPDIFISFIDIIILLVTIIGLTHYILQKKLFSPIFWKYWTVIFIVWNLLGYLPIFKIQELSLFINIIAFSTFIGIISPVPIILLNYVSKQKSIWSIDVDSDFVYLKDLKFHIGTFFYISALIYFIFHIQKLPLFESCLTDTILSVFGVFCNQATLLYLIIGFLFRVFSKTPNLMNIQNSYIKSWIFILIPAIFLIISGLMMSLICFFTEMKIDSDFLGSFIHYVIATAIMPSLIFYKLKNDLRVDTPRIENQKSKKLLSDKIIKISTFLLSILFIASGILLVLFCIFALPYNLPEPASYSLDTINTRFLIGFIYFVMAGVMMSSLIFFKLKDNLRSHTSNIQTHKNKRALFNKIIKISTFILSTLFIIWGILLAQICIFVLPDRVPRPTLSILLSIANAIVMSILITRVKRLSIFNNSQQKQILKKLSSTQS